jgi:hypothetical protein
VINNELHQHPQGYIDRISFGTLDVQDQNRLAKVNLRLQDGLSRTGASVEQQEQQLRR